MAVGRRLAAILAADVVGSSRLIGADERYALPAIRHVLHDVLVEAGTRHNGRLIKTTGDGALIEFSSAVAAVLCADEVQNTLASKNEQEPQDRRILLRIGINLGDVVVGPDGDLFGDGVNVAARLEGIASPGGVSISGKVYEELLGKLTLPWSDCGDVILKNISRSIRVWALDNQSLAPLASPYNYTSLAVPSQPSIAVLPFTNMSGDLEQEYFADGLVEEIITALSRVKSFFVIARNSSFTYKGKAVDIRRVGCELGVRYVLEGSVRKAGGRVRITGQLIEAETGRHVWTDRFEADLTDLFDVQDKVTEGVAAAIQPSLQAAEIKRALSKSTSNLDAYDCYIRALNQQYIMSKEGLEEAHRLLQRAVEIDPEYTRAKACRAFIYLAQIAQGWGGEWERSEGTRLATEAMAPAGDDPLSLRYSGHALAFLGRQFQVAGDALDRAIFLNPASAHIQWAAGWVNTYLGKADLAVENFTKSMRLNPMDPERGYVLSGLATAYHLLGRYQDACESGGRAVREMPDWIQGYFPLCSSLVELGRLGEARAALKEILRLRPALDATSFLAMTAQPNPLVRQRLVRNLVAAGLPA